MSVFSLDMTDPRVAAEHAAIGEGRAVACSTRARLEQLKDVRLLDRGPVLPAATAL